MRWRAAHSGVGRFSAIRAPSQRGGAEAGAAVPDRHAEPPQRVELVACNNSFHGRTFGRAIGDRQEKYRTGFDRLLEPVRFIPFGDIAAGAPAIGTQTCAVISSHPGRGRDPASAGRLPAGAATPLYRDRNGVDLRRGPDRRRAAPGHFMRSRMKRGARHRDAGQGAGREASPSARCWPTKRSPAASSRHARLYLRRQSAVDGRALYVQQALDQDNLLERSRDVGSHLARRCCACERRRPARAAPGAAVFCRGWCWTAMRRRWWRARATRVSCVSRGGNVVRVCAAAGGVEVRGGPGRSPSSMRRWRRPLIQRQRAIMTSGAKTFSRSGSGRRRIESLIRRAEEFRLLRSLREPHGTRPAVCWG